MSEPRAIVFVGPTIDVASATAILDASYRPPVRMGDVFRVVMEERVDAIGIIDGLFDRVPSVWHKEILFALTSGIRVYGAASMGALRAAELAPFGMCGVGRIFEAFAREELEDDDEVAVVHGPTEAGHRAMSDAMVSLRHGLSLAQQAGQVSAATAQTLERAAKQLGYPDRSWARLYQLAPSLGIAGAEIDALRGFVSATQPDLKRADATLLLERMSRERSSWSEPRAAGFDFEPTGYWEKLVAIMSRPAQHARELASDDLRRELLAARDHDESTRGALFLDLLAREAARAAVPISSSDTRLAAEQFRRNRGLATAASLRAWMTENDVDDDELARLVHLEALAHAVAREGGAIDAHLALEAKRRGTYARTVRRVAEKREALRRIGHEHPKLEDLDIDLEGLLAWYEQTYERQVGDLEAHARGLRFTSAADFVEFLVGEYLFARAG